MSSFTTSFTNLPSARPRSFCAASGITFLNSRAVLGDEGLDLGANLVGRELAREVGLDDLELTLLLLHQVGAVGLLRELEGLGAG